MKPERKLAEKFLGIIPNDEAHENQIEYLAYLIKEHVNEQLRQHGVVRGGDFENEIVPGEEVLFETTTVTETPNTPTELLATEAQDTVAEALANPCVRCKKDVGNDCFTICDDCWELVRKSSEEQP